MHTWVPEGARGVPDGCIRMQHDWQNAIWKLLTNPAFEVVAAIVLVLIAAWFVIDTEATLSPAPRLLQYFGYK